MPQQIPVQGFCGETYQDRTLNANAARTIGFYPMRSPSVGDPNRIVLYPTPGFYTAGITTNGSGPIRGMLVINTILYFVQGSMFYKVSPGQTTATSLGTLSSTTGLVSMTCNTVQIIIADSVTGYTYNLSSGAFAAISGGCWPSSGGVTNLTFMDGYVLAGVNNSTQVIQSNNLDATTWGAQAFVNVTSFPDNVTAVFSDQLQLYIFGPHLGEVRFDAGQIPFAFEKTQGVLIQAGCVAAQTMVKVAGTLIWLAADYTRKAYIAMLTSYAPKVLSTAPINEMIERFATISDAFAYSYGEADNQFYSITFPSAGVTLVYDLRLNMWHERSYNSGADLPTCCANWNGQNIVGDLNGNLWFMSQTYSDAALGQSGALYQPGTNVPQFYPPIRTRTCSHVEAEGRMMFLHELEVFYEAGTALNPPSGQSSAIATSESTPQATLQVSRDGGHVWTTTGTMPMGVQGAYKQRMVWRNLGKARHFTFRLVISDPVRTYILGATAKMTVGTK